MCPLAPTKRNNNYHSHLHVLSSANSLLDCSTAEISFSIIIDLVTFESIRGDLVHVAGVY